MSERTGKGNVLKVTELGLDDRVFKAMRQTGFSVESLTRDLNNEGVVITSQSIRKFIKKSKKAQQEIIQTDLNAAAGYKKLTMDYSKALNDILHEVEEVKQDTKNEKDYATYNQMVGRLMQGIELIAKLTGDIKPSNSIDINIIYNEISDNVTKQMSNVKKEMFRDARIIDIEAEILEEDLELQEEINK